MTNPYIVIERVDSFPVIDGELSVELERWLRALVETLNAAIEQIETELNDLDARVTALGG